MAKHITIGLWTATAVGLGAIIGSGIFVLSGTAIALAGAYAIFAFFIVGIIALIIAAELRELVAILPNAMGGVYSYVREAFGS
jgi:APA family basic amino acid/polyamine antiporter